MEKRDNKPQEKAKEESSDFGLPKATFQPIERRKRNYRGLKILMIIIGVILLLGSVYYWIFKNSSDKVKYLTPEELATYESPPEVMFFEDDLTTKEDSTTEKSDFEVKKEDQPATGDNREMLMEEPEETRVLPSTDTEGEITKISAPQGTYFVVVSSFVDSDMALDYANQLTKQGVNVMFIEPDKKRYFFRVAVDQASTFYEAHDKAAALQSLYGEDIWVLKY
ncbi:MAG: SPOR domain-containing protein [Cytophagales bacterium]|nr:SPOR domain-containing protein [Cytophagales bacterium]